MVRVGERRRLGEKVTYNCGGTLITDRHVLTAAHCLSDKDVVDVVLGDTNTRTKFDCLYPEPGYCQSHDRACWEQWDCADEHIKRRVTAKSIHPAFNKLGYLENDVGIITLVTPVSNTDFIVPVCLPSVQSQEDRSYFVTGWGKTGTWEQEGTDSLQEVEVGLVGREECEEVWGQELLDSQQCANGKQYKTSVCEGDSGGPMVARRAGVFEQVAVVTAGDFKCGDAKPTFFTWITPKILQWIKDEIEY